MADILTSNMIGASPDDIAANAISDAFAELIAFLRSVGRMSRASDNYQFLNRVDGAKYEMDGPQMIQMFDNLDACRRDKCILHFMERITENPAGLMIDIDCKQNSPAASRFTPELMLDYASILAESISRIYAPLAAERRTVDPFAFAQVSEDSGECDVCERDADDLRPYHIFVSRRTKITLDATGTQYKDGIHMVVPEIWARKNIRKIICGGFHNAIASRYGKEAAATVDLQSAVVQQHLFGSNKIGGVPYELMCVFRVVSRNGACNLIQLPVSPIIDGNSAAIEDGGVHINLVYELSLTQYVPILRGQPTWLRKEYLQIPPHNKHLEERELSPVDHLSSVRTRSLDDQLSSLIGANAEAKYINDLVNALPDSYAAEYAKWRNVLMIIAMPLSVARIEYEPIARQFSMRCAAKFSAAGFEQMWSNIISRRLDAARSRLTIHSLEYWAKIENPAAYEIAQRDNARNFLKTRIYESAGKLTHSDITNVLARLYRSRFAIDVDSADTSRQRHWYEFSERHDETIYKWVISSEPLSLVTYTHGTVRDLCKDILTEIEHNARRSTNEQESEKQGKIAISLRASIRKMGESPFMNGVLSGLIAHEAFNRRGFAAALDSDRHIIGVENGILMFLDGDDREARLIRGYHEYRVMNFAPTHYIPYDESNTRVQDILRAYRDIYIESDMCEFVLLYLSTWLDLDDVARIILLLGGGGSNGKTWSVAFVKAALGDKYVQSLRMELLTEDREKAREANSALMRLKGLRGGFFDEAKEGAQINPARIKTIVTPGVQTGRDLYSREEQFRNTANTIAISNYEFIVNSTDDGTWDRIKYYQCKARFVHNPDPSSAFERKIRPELTHDWPNDPDMRSAMLSILVHYRRKLEIEYGGDLRRVPCPTIDRETREFRTKQDPIARFISDRIVISPMSNAPIMQLIDAYREWYYATIGVRAPPAARIENQFENSRLRQYIKNEDGRGVYVQGIRARALHGDHLQDDETLIN